MGTRTPLLACWLFFFALAPAVASAQPRLVNGKLEQRAVTQGLEREVRALAVGAREPVWIGYAVPVVAGDHHICCSGDSWNGGACCDGCALEASGTRHEGTTVRSGEASRDPRPVPLESSDQLFVLLRAENGQVGKVRVFSADCALDAGGRTLYWLAGIRPADSVAYLAALVDQAKPIEEHERGERLWHHAVMAIALHADPSASRALERFVGAGQPLAVRKQAAFWLASARGAEGFEAVRRAFGEEADAAVRKAFVFPISISREPDAVNALIAAARDDRSPAVRGEALFWVAQKAGKKAAAAIGQAITDDPDTEVKKRAVFALSQLPKDEGVPKLIEVAKTNRNAAVRKQAIFWLGQSHDPRALAFFEQVLLGR